MATLEQNETEKQDDEQPLTLKERFLGVVIGAMFLAAVAIIIHIGVFVFSVVLILLDVVSATILYPSRFLAFTVLCNIWMLVFSLPFAVGVLVLGAVILVIFALRETTAPKRKKVVWWIGVMMVLVLALSIFAFIPLYPAPTETIVDIHYSNYDEYEDWTLDVELAGLQLGVAYYCYIQWGKFLEEGYNIVRDAESADFTPTGTTYIREFELTRKYYPDDDLIVQLYFANYIMPFSSHRLLRAEVNIKLG